MADATSRADASKQATPMTAPTKNEMSDDRCQTYHFSATVVLGFAVSKQH